MYYKDNKTVHANKKRIQKSFARAAGTYDRQAVIQRRVADRLVSLLHKSCATTPTRVLEIGCCTGILTRRLLEQYPGITALYVNDLVPEFSSKVLAEIPRGCNSVFLAGDIESIDLPAGLDLVISSSTFHWLADLPALLDRISGRMSPGGALCFTIYGTANFRELRDITGKGLDYFPSDALRKLVARNFTVQTCEDERITLHFDDPLMLLHHLRETGVNALGTSAWTRSRLNEFIKSYTERFSSQEGIPLTYHPVYCVARKI